MRPASLLFALIVLVGGGRAARAERPLSLADAVAEARRRRPEVGQAELDRQLARLGLLRAGLQRFRLTVDGRLSEQVDRYYINAPTELCESIDGLCQGNRRSRLYGFSASLSVPVWTGFGLESAWARARQLEKSAAARERMQLQAITLEVTNAYWAVRGAELALEAAKAALERRIAIANAIRARAEAGIAPRPDLNRSEIAVLRQEASVRSLDGRVSESRAALAAALHIEGDVALSDDPRQVVASLPALAEALAAARKLRPELERASAETRAQGEQVSVLKGDFWPHLSLFARAEAQNEAFGVPQPSLIGNYSAGLLLNWLIFDSLGTYEATRSAEAERRKLALDELRVVTLVEADVRAAHARLASAMAQREPLTKARALAETTLELLRRRYQAGGALLIEVLAGEEELEALDASVLENAVALAQARAGLDAAIGGGP